MIGRRCTCAVVALIAAASGVCAGKEGSGEVLWLTFERDRPWWPHPRQKSSITTVPGASGQCMKLSGRHRGGDWQYCVGPTFPLQPGRRYRLSGRLLVKQISRPWRLPYFRIQLLSEGGKRQIANVSTRHYRVWEGGWQKLVGRFVCPEGVEAGRVSLEKGDGEAMDVEAYVDDVRVVEVEAFDDPRFDPPASAVTGHPRLYFRAADVAALKAKTTTKVGAPYFAALKKVADRALKLPLVRPTENWRSRRILDIVPPCALMHVLTGERKYATRAIRAMLAAAEWPDWVQNVNRDKYPSDLATGETCVAIGCGYDWLHGAMTGARRAKIRDAIVRFGIRPYLETIRKGAKWAGWQAHNWTGVCNGGVGVAALAIQDESPEANAALAYAVHDIERYARSWCYGRDGGYLEGVMYWSYGTYYLSLFAEAMRTAAGVDTGMLALGPVRRSPWFSIYFTMPDGIIANFSDAYDVEWSKGYGGAFAGLFASRCTRPEHAADRRAYLWWADHGAKVGGWAGSAFAFLWRPSDVAPTDPPPLAKARHFRGVGWAVLRSESVYRPRVYFAFKSGDLGANHANYDLNSFLLFAHGERLTHDPGYGVLPTQHHSTILVDGKGQRPGSRGRIRHCEQRKGFAYLVGDASNAYGNALTRFRRHVVFVAGGRVLVMLDELAAARPSAFQWLLNTKNSIELSAERREATIHTSEAVLSVKSLLPAGVQMAVHKRNGRILEIANAEKRGRLHFLTVLVPRKAESATAKASVEQTDDGLIVKTAVGEAVDRVHFRVDEIGECSLQNVNGESWTPAEK